MDRKRPVETGIAISDVVRLEGDLSDDDLAQEVMDRFRASRDDSFLERERDWPKAILYYEGEQWIRWNEVVGWVPMRISRERKAIENLIIGRVMQGLAGLSQSRPTFATVPKSLDRVGRLIAESGDKILIHDWYKLRMGLERNFALLNCLVMGTGILESGVDLVGGRVRPIYQAARDGAGKPMLNDLGRPVYVNDKNGEPKIESMLRDPEFFCRSDSPFSFFPPPGLEKPSLRDAPWVIRTTFMGEAQIRRTFDLKADFDLGEPTGEDAETGSMQSYLSRFSVRYQGTSDRKRGQYEVVQYYQRADDVKGFEHGKVLSVVNEKLIGNTRSLWDDGRLPFHVFPYLPIPGRFWAMGFVLPLCDPQRRVNAALSDILQHIALVCRPNYFAPKGSGLPQEMIWNFKTYSYNAAVGAGQFAVPPTPSQALFEILQDQIKAFDRVAMMFAFSRGEPVPNVPSAYYAQIMAENDAKSQGPIIRAHADAWEELGAALLELHRLHDTSERLVHIIGASNEPELTAFSGAMLEQDLPVFVQENSLTAYSPAARTSELQTMLGAGLFGAPDAIAQNSKLRKRLREYLHMPDLTDVESEDTALEKFSQKWLSRVIDKGMDITPAIKDWWPVRELLALLDQTLLEVEDDVLTQERLDLIDAVRADLQDRVTQLDQQEQAQMQAQQEQMMAQQRELKDIDTKSKVQVATATAAAQRGVDLIASEAEPPKAPQEKEQPSGD